MTRSQYLAANRRAYFILVMIFSYFLVTLIGGIALNGMEKNMIVQIVVVVLAAIGSTVSLKKLPDKRVGMISMMACGAITYTVIALLNRNEYAFIYAFVFIIMSMFFYNLRLVVLGNVVVFISNIVRMSLTGGFSDSMSTQKSIVVICTLVMVAIN